MNRRRPKMSRYHSEWEQVVNEINGRAHDEFDRWKLLLSEVVEPVLKRNALYQHRCSNRSSFANSGICLVIENIRQYIAKRPSQLDEGLKQKLVLFGELAYEFWLLGHKLESVYDGMLQKRINEFFRGGSYYEQGEAGFRQFEYEIQAICRLVEAGIAFAENSGQGEPDLTVLPDGDTFQLEIKLPLSPNPDGAVRKALKQIGSRPGVVLVSLDAALDGVPPKDRLSKARVIAAGILKALGNRENVTAVIEFYVENATEFGWVGKYPTIGTVTILNALRGGTYTIDNLPRPIA